MPKSRRHTHKHVRVLTHNRKVHLLAHNTNLYPYRHDILSIQIGIHFFFFPWQRSQADTPPPTRLDWSLDNANSKYGILCQEELKSKFQGVWMENASE